MFKGRTLQQYGLCLHISHQSFVLTRWGSSYAVRYSTRPSATRVRFHCTGPGSRCRTTDGNLLGVFEELFEKEPGTGGNCTIDYLLKLKI